MKKFFLAGVIYAWLAFAAWSQTNVTAQASQLELQGDFKQAATVLRAAIASGNYSPAETKTLEFEADRLRRIKMDYSLTQERLFAELSDSVRDLTRAEFDKWIKLGWFDGRPIDGSEFYFKDSVDNLYFRHPEFDARRMDGKDKRQKELFRLSEVTAIKQASLEQKSPYVLPKTFHINTTVTVASNTTPKDETIRAWIPIPRKNAFQSDFKLISSAAAPKSIDVESSPIRSIYFEEPSAGNVSTKFAIEYEYTIRGVHFDLQPEKIQPYDPNDEAVKLFTGEAQHVVFTPEIKALSASIVGGETNPMLKAKKIFDWQSSHLQYSYALEYSTIRNISDYCRSHGYGDCGQQALLFITLCRYNGVPARWQTGWDLTPNGTTIHDWTEIYLAPYGWVPVDPYMGNYAMRYITTLTAAQRIEIRDFYFGGLDRYRMIANSDHEQQLNPPKQSFRSDDVDFQRAEIEHNGTNIYFDQFSYKLTYKMIPPSTVP
ncbi:MAG TPA: transglutaminase domain-containing protein [Verrucomicrobiae bacterium]|jgi:transglutaminase-like putative cysteine protease|nr:transglutaminase domain-containing protein [Verrucomicrobiae bacterium]